MTVIPVKEGERLYRWVKCSERMPPWQKQAEGYFVRGEDYENFLMFQKGIFFPKNTSTKYQVLSVEEWLEEVPPRCGPRPSNLQNYELKS